MKYIEFNKKYRFPKRTYLYLIFKMVLSIAIAACVGIILCGVDNILILLFFLAPALVVVLVIMGVNYVGTSFEIYEDKIVLNSGFSAKESKTILFCDINNIEIIPNTTMNILHISKVKISTASVDQLQKEGVPSSITLFFSSLRAQALKDLIESKTK